MKNRITDFDISLGFGIYGPFSRWVFGIDGRPLNETLRLWRRGLLHSMTGRITILGFFIEYQLNSVGKTE